MKKKIAFTMLSVMATGLVSFLMSVVFDVYDLKAQVLSNKNVVNLIYDDVKIIKNHLINGE